MNIDIYVCDSCCIAHNPAPKCPICGYVYPVNNEERTMISDCNICVHDMNQVKKEMGGSKACIIEEREEISLGYPLIGIYCDEFLRAPGIDEDD